MTPDTIQAWLDLNPQLMPWVLGAAALLASVLVFLIARFFIARGLFALSRRTETKYDDIVVDKLRPFRFAWIAPAVLIYYFAHLVPEGAELVQQMALFFILWLVVMTANSLLNAANVIYESSSHYRGESIQSYLDLVKVVLILAAIILTISLFTGQSPLVLLSGLGVLMALLVMVFRDTILGFVASVQINSNDLLKEGDWIEMPSFNADGEILNISLHNVVVQNGDKTISVIPTYKFLDTPYRNWRGVLDSGGRRIKRALRIDLNSVRFCDRAMLERFQRIDLIQDHVRRLLAQAASGGNGSGLDPQNPFDNPLPTNVEVFQAYALNYVRNRTDIHREGMILVVRQLAPAPDGLPLEVFAFTKTTEFAEYESIQAEIFDHLLAALPQFDLQVFQQPTGADFRVFNATSR